MDSPRRKRDPFTHIRAQLISHPEGYNIIDLVYETALPISTVARQVEEWGARQVTRGVYTLDLTDQDIELARAVLKRVGDLA
jgi:hypothetical protein